MAPLLKEIGEAFYRWQPRNNSRPSDMEQALVRPGCNGPARCRAWPTASSWYNPGERFDSMRHNASKPGVEITQVLGWIVLRDNGKVYTKAAVAVK